MSTYLRAIGSRMGELSAPGELRFWITPDSELISESPHVTHHRVSSARAGLVTLLRPARLDALRADDVFHAPANVLGFGLPCRTIVTLHDILWLTHPEWCQPKRWALPFSRRYFGTGIRNAMRNATRIATVTQASADSIVQYAPETRSRLVVIPNAADPEFRPPLSREAAARRAGEILGFDAPYFLVVGHNQESKGHSYALEGFAALQAPGVRLVFVQRLNRDGALYRMAERLGVAERVSFLGALARPALVPVLQSALALVHPSRSEGFGIPPLEAMSVGCPVIASDIPALREVIGGAGLLVPPASAGALAQAMQRMRDDAVLRTELRARGLERAPVYSWDKTAALTYELYREVAR